MFKNDPNEFYRACANADKISQHLIQHYEHNQEQKKINMQILDTHSYNTDYLRLIKSELKSNHFTCNDVILNNVNKLNGITSKHHTLKEIHSKSCNISLLSKEEQPIIQELARELQCQEMHRQQPAIPMPVAPEL